MSRKKMLLYCRMFKQLLRANHASSYARGAMVSMNCKMRGIHLHGGKVGDRLRKDSLSNEEKNRERERGGVIYNFSMVER